MVCTGNICRSVTAHQVLQEAVDRAGLGDAISVDSCGISSEEYGNPPDRRAAAVLRERGHDVPDHRARQVRPADFDDADLILAMTAVHFRSLQRIAAKPGLFGRRRYANAVDISGKIRMYREFDPQLAGVFEEGADIEAGLEKTLAIRNTALGSLDVPDPWYGTYEDFQETLDVVERVTPNIVAFIRSQWAG